MSLKNSWGNLHVKTHASKKNSLTFLGQQTCKFQWKLALFVEGLRFPGFSRHGRLRCPLWNGQNGTCRAHKEVVRWGGIEGIEWYANGTLNSQFIYDLICSWFFLLGKKKKAFSRVVHLESYHWTDIELTIKKYTFRIASKPYTVCGSKYYPYFERLVFYGVFPIAPRGSELYLLDPKMARIGFVPIHLLKLFCERLSKPLSLIKLVYLVVSPHVATISQWLSLVWVGLDSRVVSQTTNPKRQTTN